MYSVVLMMALTGGAEVPESHNLGGCWGSSCSGCTGGSCHGGGLFHRHGCNGGCTGVVVSSGCWGCTGGCGGCTGGHRLLGGGGLFHKHGGSCCGTPAPVCCAPVAPCCGGAISAPTTPGVIAPTPMPAAPKPVAPAKPGTAMVEPSTTPVEANGAYVVESAPQRRILGGGLFARRNRN